MAIALFSKTLGASFFTLLILSAAEPSCEAQLSEVSALLQTVPRNVSDVLHEAAPRSSVGFQEIHHEERGPQGPQGPQGAQGPQGPQGRPQGSPAVADAVAVLLVLLQFAAVSPVAYCDSFSAFLVVIIYLCSVTSVKFFVKDTINHGFAYPSCITGFHMIAVCITILAWGERPQWKEAMAVLPISLLNSASLLTNNAALVFGGLAFVSMIDAMGPFVTFLLEVAKGTRPCFHLMTIFSVTIASVGSVLCVRGEASTVKGISITAITLAGISAVLRSMRAVWQHDLLTDKSITVSPLQLVFWNGFWGAWMTMISMLFSNEHFQGIQHLSTMSASAKLFLFFSVPAAVTLNITQWYAVKKHGALMQNIIGNLNLVTVIAISKAILFEEVTLTQYIGTILLVCGTILNKAVDVQHPKDPEK